MTRSSQYSRYFVEFEKRLITDLDALATKASLLMLRGRYYVNKRPGLNVNTIERRHVTFSSDGAKLMAKEKILVVDDEEDILELIRYNLVKEGYQVSCVSSGEEALKRAREQKPDLILLDLMLPGIDGLDVCKNLKNTPETSGIPVIMITAKSEDADVVSGLELGADDYVTKPFSPRVLLARIKKTVKKSVQQEIDDVQVIRIHELLINPARHEVLIRDSPMLLTVSEFGILLFLAKRPGWVFSRDQIISAVKGDDYPVTERSVDVQIVGLRKKLGSAGNYIETVRGVGYRFKE